MLNTLEKNTCGQGLAENAVLPKKVGQLIEAMGEVLAEHMQALDLDDQNAKQEFEAYKDLVRELRWSASRLTAAAHEMAAYRDLPMGKHDETTLMHPGAVKAFTTYVEHEIDLLNLLQSAIEEDQNLLSEMRRAALFEQTQLDRRHPGAASC